MSHVSNWALALKISRTLGRVMYCGYLSPNEKELIELLEQTLVALVPAAAKPADDADDDAHAAAAAAAELEALDREGF